MYFPYLRGKQFDLLALKELKSLLYANREKISPIIEPVKSSSTLTSTLLDLSKHNINFNIIVNPKVGDLTKDTKSILESIEKPLAGHSFYQIAVLIEPKTDYEELLTSILNYNLTPQGFTFIHNEIEDKIEDLIEYFARFYPVLNNVINFKRTNRRYDRKFESGTKVSLDDYFVCQPRNVDYYEQDSQFSDEHLYYKEEGFKGFSDFMTVGSNYSEGGFLPYAVAIHISYKDEKGAIRVKHFVSESNTDDKDTPGKFFEANAKLVKWCDENDLHTKAIDTFRRLQESGNFPGLGTVKKLSIMNHIELVLSLI